MKSTNVQIVLFGSLRYELGICEGETIKFSIDGPASLGEIVNNLKISEGKIQMVMVNHKAVAPTQPIHPGDRVALFPKEYPLFADWYHYRCDH